MQAGIRWVPIKPLVLAPHTKKLPARIQNSRERAAQNRPPSGERATLGSAGDPGGPPRAPYGSRPTSEGRSLNHTSTTKNTAAAAPATMYVALRQPCPGT